MADMSAFGRRDEEWLGIAGKANNARKHGSYVTIIRSRRRSHGSTGPPTLLTEKRSRCVQRVGGCSQNPSELPGRSLPAIARRWMDLLSRRARL